MARPAVQLFSGGLRPPSTRTDSRARPFGLAPPGAAEVALVGNLRNTQPEATIVVERRHFNEVSLSARVWDAEGDALNLTWMLPRIGVFEQNTIDVALPPARQPVILFVRDAHLANTVAAVWLDGRRGESWEG